MKHWNGLDIPRALEDVCEPRRMALLVYDMQVGICGQIKDGANVIARVGELLEAARSAGVRVAHTRHMSLPRAWMGASQVRMAMAWQRTEEPEAVQPWFLRDSPAFAIVPELAPRADEVVFDKLAMSAFEGTPLATALRDRGVTAVAVAGVATEIGIEPTVRHAADLGFIPVIVEDACAAGHAEAGVRSLEALRFAGDAMFADSATVQDLWAGQPRPL